MTDGAARADYGIDAPGVIRNLAITAVCGLAVFATAAVGWWSGFIHVPFGSIDVQVGLAPTGLGLGLVCGGIAASMLWSSIFGKLRAREKLLDLIPLSGDERVLDVGCGRGLMLIGAAHRLRTGRAVGIDIWRSEDLSDNRAASTLDNARAEGVVDRVEVQTADMRRLPFPDGSFDAIVSRFAIHNLDHAADRAQAIREIARVLKPGGFVGILEFSEPGSGLLASAFRFYFRRILPRVGALVSGSSEAYSYLPASVGRFPAANELAALMEQCGFADASFVAWNFGSVLLHTGRRVS